jgi:hypothetical protein
VILGALVFSAPLVLIACLAAMVPLVLHLLGRARAVRFEFPALRFIRTAAARTANRRRLENVALLVFRMGLFILLPVAVALPFYRSSAAKFGARGNLALAVVLDNTASMAQQAKGQSAFDHAKLQALRLLRGTDALAPPETAILLCPVQHPPVVTSNLAQLADRIRALVPTGAETGLASAVKQAETLLDDQTAPNKLVYVLTDLQKSGLEPEELRNLKYPVALLDLHLPGDNLGIPDVTFSSPLIAGRPATVTIRLAGALASPRNLAIRLTDDRDRILHTHEVIYTGGPLEPISFEVTPPARGPFNGGIELLIDDRLPLDNRWYFAGAVNPPIQALIWSDSLPPFPAADDPAFFLTAALNAPGWIDARATVKPAAADLNRAAILYVPQTARCDAGIIDAFLNVPGKSVVLFASLENSNPLLVHLGLGNAPVLATAQTPKTVDQIDAADPLLAAVGLKSDVYHRIAVGRYLKLAPAPDVEPLLILAGGDPLLVKRKIGRSTLYCFATPAQTVYGTLPLNPAFPAILAQIAADTAAPNAATFRAGRAFTFTASRNEKLTAPNSQPAAALSPGRNQLTFYTPGFYKSATNTLAVNASEKANDLTSWPLTVFAARSSSVLFAADTPESPHRPCPGHSSLGHAPLHPPRRPSRRNSPRQPPQTRPGPFELRRTPFHNGMLVMDIVHPRGIPDRAITSAVFC